MRNMDSVSDNFYINIDPFYKTYHRLITKVIFRDRATTVFFDDNTKTVVKLANTDLYDPEMAIKWAIIKRYGLRSYVESLRKAGSFSYETLVSVLVLMLGYGDEIGKFAKSDESYYDKNATFALATETIVRNVLFG